MAHTYVLIHGAWHGGWCWQRVAAVLQAGGHRVYAPTLTGVCERSHLASGDVNLTTHILDVVNEIKWKDLRDVVLCGHSYGGMVITGALEQIAEQVASIVYIDAFLPKNGQSLDDIVGGARLLTNGMAPPFKAEHFRVNEADCAWVNARMTPHPGACFSEKLSVTGALNAIARKAYVLAANYQNPKFVATYESLTRDPAWHTHKVAAGHDVMIDKPLELAQILMQSA